MKLWKLALRDHLNTDAQARNRTLNFFSRERRLNCSATAPQMDCHVLMLVGIDEFHRIDMMMKC